MSATLITVPLRSRLATLDINASDAYQAKGGNVISSITGQTLYETGDYKETFAGQILQFEMSSIISASYVFRPIESAQLRLKGICSYTPPAAGVGYVTQPGCYAVQTNSDSIDGTRISQSVFNKYPWLTRDYTAGDKDILIDTSVSVDNVKSFFNGTRVLKIAFKPRSQSASSQDQRINYKIYSETSGSANRPQLSVSFGDANRVMSVSSTTPAEGSKHSPVYGVKATCYLARDNAISIAEIGVSTARFLYRAKDGSATSVDLEASADKVFYSYDIPRNTLSAGEYEYQFAFTANTGASFSSPWVSFSISDTIPDAPIIYSPKAGDIVNVNNDITFKWYHRNASGIAASKSELQYKIGGGWSAAITVLGAVYSYAMPADTFATGEIEWRVRTFNSTDDPGPWASDHFTGVGAPRAPVVEITDSSPMPSIRWTTNEQAAYQVEVDGVIVETGFGAQNTWTAKEHFKNNVAHTFRVRAQSIYGLWSNWGDAQLQVTNTGEHIDLSVVAVPAGAQLNWTTPRACDFFRIYRDGVCIAELQPTESSYIDEFACGAVEYEVRGCFSSTHQYDMSDTVAARVIPEHNRIRAVVVSGWLDMPLSDVQYKSESVKTSRRVNLIHMAGRPYYELNRSEHYEESMSVVCAFTPEDVESMRRLESLTGELVVLQTNNGRRIIGVLEALSITDREFYTGYSFSVTKTNYSEDVING